MNEGVYMNGVVILMGVLLLFLMIKLILRHQWIRLFLFFFVLYLVFGTHPHTW